MVTISHSTLTILFFINITALVSLHGEEQAVTSERKYNEWSLINFAAEGNVAGVQACLDQGINVNAIIVNDPAYHTALFLACNWGHYEVVQRLLKRPDINVNAVDYLGNTPLSEACAEDCYEIVKLLLTMPGIKINTSDTEYKFSPLHHAVQSNNSKIAQLLLNMPNIDVNVLDIKDRTPLHRVIYDEYRKHETKKIVRLLIQHYAHIDSKVLSTAKQVEKLELLITQTITDNLVHNFNLSNDLCIHHLRSTEFIKTALQELWHIDLASTDNQKFIDTIVETVQKRLKIALSKNHLHTPVTQPLTLLLQPTPSTAFCMQEQPLPVYNALSFTKYRK